MVKNVHEIRDPIHVFVKLDSFERLVLDSRPFQRLRHINQLALTYLIYPAATHKRFEHSLGVMELAGRVFDVICQRDKTDEIRELLPEVTRPDSLSYWRRVLRMAALCHDVGHLPFSHAAEDELLPPGWSHERLTRELILSEEMQAIWTRMDPPLSSVHIVKLAVGARKAPDLPFSKWERLLSEIIVGDAFGVDRIDYLLRDSHHTGVAYGKFDHYRLIDTIRILPSFQNSTEPVLGIEEGGIYSAEALSLARYFMFSQVYFHPIRLVYDRHLKDFLGAWLAEGTLLGVGTFPTDVENHLRMTDNEVNVALAKAASDASKAGHDPARRILQHKHFKVLYERTPQDAAKNPDPAFTIYKAVRDQFGEDATRYQKPTLKVVELDFPVRMRDGRIELALSVSEAISKLKPTSIDYVFVAPESEEKARKWLKQNQERTLATGDEEDDEENPTGSNTSVSR
jgi:uncharacterized protein